MERAKLAKLGGALAAASFSVQFAGLDLAFRGASAWAHAAPGTLLAAVTSALAWALVASFAKGRAVRAVAALAAGLLLVLQAWVFRYYHAPLDAQVAASALHAFGDIKPVLVRGAPSFAGAVLVVAALEYALLALARPPLFVRRRRYLAALAGVGLVVLPPRAGTPDVRGLHALVALRERQASAATARDPLPPLHSDRRTLPHVLTILSESIRAEDYDHETAPRTLAREHVDLTEMRSIASYTALSFSTVLRGRTQLGEREAILRTPSFFDYARAARPGDGGPRPTVIYASAQSEAVLEPRELRGAIDRFTTSETLLAGKDEEALELEGGADTLLVDRFVSELDATKGGVVAMLHLTDTHAPYAIDPALAPFQPADHVVAWSHMGSLHNAYKDAILLQDRAVARAIDAFVRHAGASPWIVVFTSDHGEAFGEHGAIHHGQNLFDEQVHVPAWIAASPDALTPEQWRALRDHSHRFVTHLDLLPTVLDALGLWDNFAVAPHRRAMEGRSLLRPWEPRGAIPVTNCTRMFPCPTNTWGLYGEDHKLLARIYDATWACLVVGNGPERLAEAGDPACERLRAESHAAFPLLPNGTPND